MKRIFRIARLSCFALALGAVALPAQAVDDLLTKEFGHDDVCSPDGEPFSLRSRTVFRRGFHGGDVAIEAGVSRFSLWGFGMDFATVTVQGSGLTLRKIDTRNGPHNVARSCPAEYATQTFELRSASHIPGSIDGTLVVRRGGQADWRIGIDVHSSPTGIVAAWDRIAGSGSSSTGSARPISIRQRSGCDPTLPGCGGSSGSVKAGTPTTGSVASGPADFSAFAGFKRCLNENGGDALLERPDLLVVRVPRDRVVNCREKLRGDWDVTEHGVAITAQSTVEDAIATSVRSFSPRSGEYFYGVRNEDDLEVGFRWPAIHGRFNTSLAPGPAVAPGATQNTGAARAAIENRGTQSSTAQASAPTITAEIGVTVNGRSHAPLNIRIEQMP